MASSTPVASGSPAASSSGPSATVAPSGRHHRPRSPFASPGLRAFLASRSGDVTAAVYDARDGRLWVFHPGVREYTASIVKVEIMGTALQEARQAGQGLPPAEQGLMPSMIEASDNDSATALLHDVGGASAVARFDRSAGMTDTEPSSLALIPGTPWPGWGLTTTTARDEVVLVSRFAYPNVVLSGTSRQYGLSLMENVEPGQAWGVSGGVPPGTTIALKNGWLPFGANWQINSIGWIDGHGRNYVLAVLTAANPSEAYGIDTIEGVASYVYRSGG
ncbi:MAG TPA: serine hydrolase [Streptosporangiaceae bacterium]|nr:serine hydrolase [Streptosporangiaceae bacterium]